MALARFNGLAQDEAGNVMPNALVQVRRQSTGAIVPAWADTAGTVALGSTFASDANGKFTFCVDDGFYRIRVYKAINGSLYEQVWEDVGISRAQGGELRILQPAFAWSSGGTYGLNALVSHPDSGGILRLFISAIENNFGNTPPNGASSNAQWMYAGTAVSVPSPPFPIGDLLDVEIDDPINGDVLRYDSYLDNWRNVSLAGWAPVAVEGGEAAIDIDDGDKFAIIVDADCELQVPANAVPGAPFAIRVLMDGSHAFTFGAGWRGDLPPVLLADGAETILSGIVLDTDPSTTAIINLVKAIPA